jgi:hypothetical protein
MYSDSRYAIKLPNGIADEFGFNVGIKQGCILSPLAGHVSTHKGICDAM